ncbi:LPS-assembly lipoprotein [Chromohalobacter marismortui]|uniref:LPS-assembly lipoprotein LptE n=1 Tax=Chromohalobacter marismortui TaxID=42055 RepID=A0A4R7NRJ7_9GAMM|nr:MULTISPECIES: LPS assembly lipoprotein LptE [Chromohalobacter]MCI0508692.1 LPS assembly lipoprotein LptE [Chromohalobacter sp.]MCI0593496.1 LPS assembly lipoprotein LptE [Chromohalobacter sp.]TDU23171.1 LPS-assembly lipoprotein [Chromohalobacter marismortui]
MKRRSLISHALIVLATTMLLAGCGFQLRGIGDNAFDVPTVALSAPQGELRDAVVQALEGARAGPREDASLRVNLGEERISETSLTIGNSGSQQRRLTLSVPFSVQRSEDNAYVLDQQTLETSTTLSVDNDNLLSQGELRNEALASLRQEAARQLVNRLRALEIP